MKALELKGKLDVVPDTYEVKVNLNEEDIVDAVIDDDKKQILLLTDDLPF